MHLGPRREVSWVGFAYTGMGCFRGPATEHLNGINELWVVSCDVRGDYVEAPSGTGMYRLAPGQAHRHEIFTDLKVTEISSRSWLPVEGLKFIREHCKVV